MPKSSRKRVLRIQFKLSDVEKRKSQKYGAVPSFDNPDRLKQPSSLPSKVSRSKSRKSKIVRDTLSKSTMDVFTGKSPLRSRNIVVDKLPTRDTSFLNKKVSNFHMITENLVKKEQAASHFLSTLTRKGKLIRHRVATDLVGRRFWQGNEEAKRLPHSQRLQLFQALLNEPLPFLDLHARFSVSKRMIRGLVKRGFLIEVWGPKDIGVRFKLTDKGKIHLKQLEAAARYESKIGEKGLIRLKYKV